jgi:ornithine carbamoyltransferase
VATGLWVNQRHVPVLRAFAYRLAQEHGSDEEYVSATTVYAKYWLSAGTFDATEATLQWFCDHYNITLADITDMEETILSTPLGLDLVDDRKCGELFARCLAVDMG